MISWGTTIWKVVEQRREMSSKFMKCLQFAAVKHKDQRRKDRNQTPYINHPINVATILAVEGGLNEEEVLMAALLHDTVEDTETTFEEIEKLFGSKITEIVREVTDDKTLAKDERKRRQVLKAKDTSYQGKLVKLADKLDNLRDLNKTLPVGWTEERRHQYYLWAKEVVDNLRGTNDHLEALLDDFFREKGLL